MQLGEGIRVAFASLWAYKLRTFLTVLGNVVAVMSVIAVVSLIGGMDAFVRQEIAQEGSNVLTLRRVDPFQVLTDFDAFLESIHNPDITRRDYEWIRDAELDGVAAIAATDDGQGLTHVQASDGQNDASLPGDTPLSFRVFLPAPTDLVGPEGRIIAQEASLSWTEPARVAALEEPFRLVFDVLRDSAPRVPRMETPTPRQRGRREARRGAPEGNAARSET